MRLSYHAFITTPANPPKVKPAESAAAPKKLPIDPATTLPNGIEAPSDIVIGKNIL